MNAKADDTVKLDFGLSSAMLSEDMRKKWPCEFGLVYSVTLGKGKLEVQLHVQNKGDKAFDFQCLFHSYFTVKVRKSSSYCCVAVTDFRLGHLQNHSLRSRGHELRRQSPQSTNIHRRIL